MDLDHSKLIKQCQLIQEVLDSITHFSYFESRNKFLVFDIRPIWIKEKKLLIITEPVIYSTHEKRFSSSDLGLTGIQNFKKEHKCNNICFAMNLSKLIIFLDSIIYRININISK